MTEEDGKGGKMPRLTIMEEVLLLGLKDKQVRPTIFLLLPSLPFVWNRASSRGVAAIRTRSSFHALRFHCPTVPAVLF